MESTEQAIVGNSYGDVNVTGGNVQLGDRYINIYQDERRQKELAQIQFLQSVSYPEMRARLNEISDNEFDTFEWIFDSDEAADTRHSDPSRNDTKQRCKRLFLDWFSSGTGFFLVKGKPGSGKSTFMKFVFEHETTTDLLQQWSSSRPVTLLFHSFWLVGTNLQHNWKGFLASLIDQLVSGDANLLTLLPEFSKRSSSRNRQNLNDWSEKDLSRLLKMMLQDGCAYKCVFIDGLDEFDHESLHKLLEFCESVTASGVMCKICISSRPEPHILHRFRGSPSMTLQSLTYDDIYTYTLQTLRTQTSMIYTNSYDKDEEIRQIAKTICSKAEGVFVWVRYVLMNARRGFLAYDDLPDLMKRIEELPSAIQDLYQRMWRTQNTEHPVHAAETRTIFSLGRRFPMPLFQLATALDPSMSIDTIKNMQRFDEKYFVDYCDKFARKLIARTAGLVEVTMNGEHFSFDSGAVPETAAEYSIHDDPNPETKLSDSWKQVQVQYFHRTVHDFLRDTKLALVSTTDGMEEDVDRKCDVLWILSYLACLHQRVRPLDIASTMDFCRSLAWANPQCVSLIDVVDSVCDGLVRDLKTGRAVNRGDWVLQLRGPALYVYPDRFDFPGAMAQGELSCLRYLIDSRGTAWSPYYKGYLAMCIVVENNGWRPVQDGLFLKWQLLKESGADMGSIHPYVTMHGLLAMHSPASHLLLVSCITLLQFEVAADRLKSYKYIHDVIEALCGIDLREKELTVCYDTHYKLWYLADVMMSGYTFTFEARKLYKALIDTVDPSRKDLRLHQEGNNPGNYTLGDIKQAFARNLLIAPFRFHRYHHHNESNSYSFSACRPEDAVPTLNAILDSRGQHEFSLEDPGCDHTTTSIADDLDFTLTRATFREYVRPLDPEENVLQDEWKEKGILREYFKSIR